MTLDGDNVKDIIVVAGTSGNGYNENYGDDEIYAITEQLSPPGGRVLWGGNALNLGYGANSPITLSDINDDNYHDIFLEHHDPCLGTGIRADWGFLISGSRTDLSYGIIPTTLPHLHPRKVGSGMSMAKPQPLTWMATARTILLSAGPVDSAGSRPGKVAPLLSISGEVFPGMIRGT